MTIGKATAFLLPAFPRKHPAVGAEKLQLFPWPSRWKSWQLFRFLPTGKAAAFLGGITSAFLGIT